MKNALIWEVAQKASPGVQVLRYGKCMQVWSGLIEDMNFCLNYVTKMTNKIKSLEKELKEIKVLERVMQPM